MGKENDNVNPDDEIWMFPDSSNPGKLIRKRWGDMTPLERVDAETFYRTIADTINRLIDEIDEGDVGDDNTKRGTSFSNN